MKIKLTKRQDAIIASLLIAGIALLTWAWWSALDIFIYPGGFLVFLSLGFEVWFLKQKPKKKPRGIFEDKEDWGYGDG